MRIAGLLHKIGSGLEVLFSKLEGASRDSEIVIAPDYALQVDITRANTDQEYDRICRLLEKLSSKDGSLIIPGTIPHSEDGKTMTLQSPVFNKGNLQILTKETDRREEDFARSQGLTYKKGDCNKNNIPYRGRNIAVEICSDHGHQRIPQDTFLEIILAFDQKAGFWIGPSTPKFIRHIVVCDGFKPEVEGFYMDTNGKPNIWKPLEENPERRVYELK